MLFSAVKLKNLEKVYLILYITYLSTLCYKKFENIHHGLLSSYDYIIMITYTKEK